MVPLASGSNTASHGTVSDSPLFKILIFGSLWIFMFILKNMALKDDYSR